MATAKTTTLNVGTPDWRGKCAICLDLLPVEGARRIFYDCCCVKICKECSDKCEQYDSRCPLCRAPPAESAAEWLCRVQKHVDKGVAEAQSQLGDTYRASGMGLKKSFKRAFELYESAAAQGHAIAQNSLGLCYQDGEGVKINHRAVLRRLQKHADEGNPEAQIMLGDLYLDGDTDQQDFKRAVYLFELAAAQGNATAQNQLASCYAQGHDVEIDHETAARLFQRAAEQ
ncbi:hypothetical protein M885DRAFT_459749, partial [Pelagophyceae sp. CCMP2097]